MSDDPESPAEDWYDDPVAARGASYRRLLESLAALPAAAADLRQEGLEMLKAMRRSFKTERQAPEVSVVPGGKK